MPGQDVTIHFDIERKYQHLVKTDSRAEIKTIGLLGDKYLEVTPGSTDKPDLEPDHEIMAFRGAELEKILAGSGDLVDNVVAISKSLKNILGRTEKGEGFLGEITSESENGQALSRSLRQTLDSLNGLMKDVRQGKGLVGRLLSDEKTADNVLGELELGVRVAPQDPRDRREGNGHGRGTRARAPFRPGGKEEVLRDGRLAAGHRGGPRVLLEGPQGGERPPRAARFRQRILEGIPRRPQEALVPPRERRREARLHAGDGRQAHRGSGGARRDRRHPRRDQREQDAALARPRPAEIRHPEAVRRGRRRTSRPRLTPLREPRPRRRRGRLPRVRRRPEAARHRRERRPPGRRSTTPETGGP